MNENLEIEPSFVKILEYLEYLSPLEIFDCSNIFINYYLEWKIPIQIKNYVLVNYNLEKIWLEVLFSEDQLEPNKELPEYKKRLIGKVLSVPSNSNLDSNIKISYGSKVYFIKNNILDYTDFNGLLNLYIKK